MALFAVQSGQSILFGGAAGGVDGDFDRDNGGIPFKAVNGIQVDCSSATTDQVNTPTAAR